MVSSGERASSHPNRMRLRWHLLALVAGLLLLWPILDLSGVFSADEGSYGLQERALDAGTWSIGYPFAHADPDGRFVAYHGATVLGDRVVLYASHPMWPTALHAASSVMGPVIGLRALGVLSVVLVAALAWGLAGDLCGDSARPWAFWMAATSPVLVNAWVLWAHAPSAAAGGLLVLGARRSERGWPWVLVAALGAVAGVLVRSEGLLWALAVAGALILIGATARARWTGLVVAAATWGALAVERAWIASILRGPAAEPGVTSGDQLSSRGGGESIANRLSGLRIALLDGALGSHLGRLLGLAILISMLAAVILWGRRHVRLLPWLVMACSALYVARVAVAAADPIPGLLTAAPTLLLVGLWRPRTRSEWWLPLTGGLFVGSLLASIYVDGGSFQWGGRFLSPATVTLAALAAGGLQRAVARAKAVGAAPSTLVWWPIAGLLVVQAGGAIVVPNQVRRHTADAVERVVAQGPDVLLTEGGQVARLDWQGWPRRCWLALPDGADPEDARAVLDVLGQSGVRRVTVAGVDRDLRGALGLSSATVGPVVEVLEVPEGRVDATIAAPYTCGG